MSPKPLESYMFLGLAVKIDKSQHTEKPKYTDASEMKMCQPCMQPDEFDISKMVESFGKADNNG